MSYASQIMLSNYNNEGLFEEEHQDHMIMSSSSQLGINFPFQYTNFASLTKTLAAIITPPPSPTCKQDFITTPDHFAGSYSHLLSLQASAPNHWEWGELSDCMSMKRNGGDHRDHNRGLGLSSAKKMKKIIKGRRKVRDPRFCFKTMSDVDVLDDGYKWRKYGQKVVKNTQHPRSYYRCTEDNCRVKKRVERQADDPRMVITTYEGRHIHFPSQEEDDHSQSSSHHLNNFFW